MSFQTELVSIKFILDSNRGKGNSESIVASTLYNPAIIVLVYDEIIKRKLERHYAKMIKNLTLFQKIVRWYKFKKNGKYVEPIFETIKEGNFFRNSRRPIIIDNSTILALINSERNDIFIDV